MKQRRKADHRRVKYGHDVTSLHKLMRYESLKSAWTFNNPLATAQDYETAMKRIADECGV